MHVLGPGSGRIGTVVVLRVRLIIVPHQHRPAHRPDVGHPAPLPCAISLTFPLTLGHAGADGVRSSATAPLTGFRLLALCLLRRTYTSRPA
jgi:hypothetical protein